jgi:hypothetical protein
MPVQFNPEPERQLFTRSKNQIHDFFSHLLAHV